VDDTFVENIFKELMSLNSTYNNTDIFTEDESPNNISTSEFFRKLITYEKNKFPVYTRSVTNTNANVENLKRIMYDVNNVETESMKFSDVTPSSFFSVMSYSAEKNKTPRSYKYILKVFYRGS
jgi:hypothetical protein